MRRPILLHQITCYDVDMLRLEHDLRAGAVSTSDKNNLLTVVCKTEETKYVNADIPESKRIKTLQSCTSASAAETSTQASSVIICELDVSCGASRLQ